MSSKVSTVNTSRLEIRKRVPLAFLFAGLLASLLAWFYLTQTSETTTAIIRLHQLARERESLRRENAELRNEIAVRESISPIQSEAKKLGFAPPQEVEYLPLPDYQPPPSTSVSRGQDTNSSQNVASSNFWSRLWDHIWLLLSGGASKESL